MSLFSFLKFWKFGRKEKKEEQEISKKDEKKIFEKPKEEKSSREINSALHEYSSSIIVRPHITEKSNFLRSMNQYVVEVSPRANKIDVKKAIKKLFGVMPIKAQSIRVKGKKRKYGKVFGKTKDKKKVIITLNTGETIDLGEGK